MPQIQYRRTVFVAATILFTTMASSLQAIEVQGHRGCRGALPENSLPAFEAAIKESAQVLEMDLAVTKDGHLVISHDPHINTEICLNPDGSLVENPPLIKDLTLAEVKLYDCGRKPHPRFPRQVQIKNTTIPTLEEVFALVRDSSHPNAKTVGFNIETKIFPQHPEWTIGPEEFTEKVVRAFEASGFFDRITLQSFDFRTLVIGKRLNPSLKTVALIDKTDETATIDMEKIGEELGVYAISPEFSLLSNELVAKLQSKNFKVIPWTVNTESDWENVINMKVDGIITDYPADLIAYLRRREIR